MSTTFGHLDLWDQRLRLACVRTVVSLSGGQVRVGPKPHKQEIADLDAQTWLFRSFESTFIPELLQTAECARYRFAQSITVFKVRNDIDEAVAARAKHQDILYRHDKQVPSCYRLCPPEITLGQLDRLIPFSQLPNVKLGIIGFEPAHIVAPAHGFWILDADRVMVETFSAELNLAQPQEIALYGGIFESLAGVARHSRSARAIINEAITELAMEDDREDPG